ncbi:uncharacterized protein EDB91DRAFT_1248153 [Suillus paluster]|uniref:uncharacterized protein n=1 Tax=Suillus paluster TaxID=48578 RepID=UPI001B85C9B8|nr:uncharacterized protein EDB91DRAFT_1248153 [Suillus paluster]KAG1740758.1 hypothetical protein EDB91DRAFT_1248153 [Suillus paluster]
MPTGQEMTQQVLTAHEVINAVGAEFNLNTKQWVVFCMIADFFVAKYVKKNLPEDEQLRMLMTGPGGTGKTHVVKAVQCVLQHYGSALINGMTIHKGLGIKIKSKNKGKGNQDPGTTAEDYMVLISVSNHTQLQDEWKNIEFLLLDEVSLVGLQLMAEINHALQFATEKPHLWFRGVSIIFSGNFFQFPPVWGSALYTPISLYAGQNNTEILKRLGHLVWKSLNAMINLCHISDPSTSNTTCVDMGDKDNWEVAAIVTTSALWEVLNAHKADTTCPRSQTLVVCGTLDKASRELTCKERSDLLHLNVTALKSSSPLPGHISLYEGMPIILRSWNLSTNLGITNGTQGVVRKIFTEVCLVGFIYATCVLVEFPHSKVQLTDLPLGYYPIVPSTWVFTTALNDGYDQIPLPNDLFRLISLVNAVLQNTLSEILPANNLSVGALKDFKLPKIATWHYTDKISFTEDPPAGQWALQAEIPPQPYVTKLHMKFSQALLDGNLLVHDPRTPNLRYPFWVIQLWWSLHIVVRDRAWTEKRRGQGLASALVLHPLPSTCPKFGAGPMIGQADHFGPLGGSGDFTDDRPTLPHGHQTDTVSCGLFTINTIEHDVFGYKLSIANPAAERARWFCSPSQDQMDHQRAPLALDASNNEVGPSSHPGLPAQEQHEKVEKAETEQLEQERVEKAKAEPLKCSVDMNDVDMNNNSMDTDMRAS